jgi:RNA polymerase sigma factor (sigma-70 family)
MIGRGNGDRDDVRFEAMYRKFYGRTYRFFRRYGLADDQAHDLAQMTFTRIYQNFPQYRGEAEWGFIEKVARNELLNWIRAGKTAKRNAEVQSLDDIAAEQQPRIEDGPDLAERQQSQMRRARLWAAIAELPEGQRQCMELWLGDTKYDGIARTLDITVDAVKSRLRDARRSLRDTLGEALPEDDE